jgi:uncharacterized protein (TIGR02996 family)
MDFETMLAGIERDPADRVAWLALADALEEHGETERAEVLRLGLQVREAPEDKKSEAAERRLRALLRDGVTAGHPVRTIHEIGMKLVLLPPGSFLMGSEKPAGQGLPSHGPKHLVTLTKGFYIAIVPVTQAQWRPVLDRLPGGCSFKGDDMPAHGVSWQDCQRFCEKLSNKIGRSVRLPSEAEWEYACRAGTTTMYCFGNEAKYLSGYAWFGNNVSGPQPVGQKKGNLWGLFDMHGNITEWCRDWFSDGYDSTEPRIDPAGPQKGTMRLLRGGAWYSQADLCRSPHRARNAPGESYHGYGFRVVMEVE